MSGVQTITVRPDDGEQRLDRWFKKHYPQLGHVALQKLLRTGQVRVDGKRVQAGFRLEAGQNVRVPPLPPSDAPAPAKPRAPSRISDDDRAFIANLVLHKDAELIVLNKPAGLAVQGGTKTERHIDGLLPALAEGDEQLRLVHRLDKDTSGLLVVARNARAARALTEAFRRHQVTKLYWALVVGRPALADGVIDLPLDKGDQAGREKMALSEAGKRAITRYVTVARAGRIATWLAMLPETGRTHQLRVHCAQALDCPILGDGKYGGARARLEGAPRGLMLHAAELDLPHPAGGRLTVRARPSSVFQAGMAFLGFEPGDNPGARLADLRDV